MAPKNEKVDVVKRVKFTGDAPKPKRMPTGTFGFRSPLQLTIPPGGEQIVDLGITCDRFVSLLPHNKLVPSREVVCVPNQPIKIAIKNFDAAPAFIEIGDTVLQGVVLDSSDFVTE